ncbi:pyridoxal phosphate-dependent aminotransferase [Brevibacterium otitidis]|uniref:Aminotransferase n=1 Tax=Brevibacterium otitidis TaxID=53364 RepID=A0ABV5WZ51_9MICO|nr:pyridoxal phosphate-dependent aminotransferase [Brevibacterium otitidis]
MTQRSIRISERAQTVRPFAVMDIVSRVAELRAEGRDVISLCVGEPGQGAPAAVRQRAQELMRDGTDLGYVPVTGIRELREALSGHYRRWYDLDVPADRFFVTTGSSGGFLLAFLAAFDAGDRVALARPGYAAYKNILTALGCEVVELDCGVAERFQPTVELLEAAHAEAPLRGLMVASPANPTGTMLDRESLIELAGWCRAHDVQLISDEIYHGVTFPGTEATAGGNPNGETAIAYADEAIVISSFSKFWGMTGWRLGWAIMPEPIHQAAAGLAGNLTLCAPVPAQHAAVAAFSDAAYAEGEAAVAGFAAARQYVLDAVDELGWKDLAPCDGAFYMYADITGVLGPYATATEWCAALLEEEGVALSPGLDFDSVHGDECVRLSLAAGPDAISAALARIRTFTDRVRDAG